MIEKYLKFFDKAYFCFLILSLNLVLFPLEAYTIFNIPIPWLSIFISFFSFLAYVKDYKKLTAHLNLFFAIFLIYAFTITISSWFTFPLLSKKILLHSNLRLFNLLFFTLLVLICWQYFEVKKNEKILAIFAKITIIVSVYALYLYRSEDYGLPYFPKSDRIALPKDYTFPIFRATGTFVEPGALGAFLALGYQSILLLKGKYLRFFGLTVTMAAFLLSGSFGGFLTICAGAWIWLLFKFGRKNIPIIITTFLASLIIFYALVKPGQTADQYNSKYGSLFQHTYERSNSLMLYGLNQSNRDYMWNYVKNQPLEIFGQGLGISNFIFAKHSGSDLTVPQALLSVVSNTYMSLGIAGSTLLLLAIINLLLNTNFKIQTEEQLILLSMSLSSVIIFLGLYEEPRFLPLLVILLFFIQMKRSKNAT